MRLVPGNERGLAGYLLTQNATTPEELLQKPGVDVPWLMHEAARQNLVGRLEELVNKHGADVNEASIINDETGAFTPPLIAAATLGSAAAVTWLLEHGADVEGRTGGDDDGDFASLWGAAMHGNVRIARILLDFGADVDAAKRPTGNTPLFMAVQNGHKSMVTLLLRAGADLERAGASGASPMMVALAAARLDMMAQLRGAGARIPMARTMMLLRQMRETKRTCINGGHREVTDAEIQSMEELLGGNPQLEANTQYQESMRLELKGQYREALRLLAEVPPCTQLKLDMKRLVEAVYGVTGSDGRVSVWNSCPVMSDELPESLTFYAWARCGGDIFRHGGADWVRHQFNPTLDEMWVFNIEARTWRHQATTGQTPGPRVGHTLFVFGGNLFLWGGRSANPRSKIQPIITDTKLYRLDINTCEWSVVKTKGSNRPPAREEHAGVVYKGHYYMSGGLLASGGYPTNDLWCLNLSNFKWISLKSGRTERHRHGMFAANGKVYVLGGCTKERYIENPVIAAHGVEDFACFHIKHKQWADIRITGDRPYDISEFTILPLHRGKEEPSAIIVWGGYIQPDVTEGSPSIDSMKAKYGVEYEDFRISYVSRILRFDLSTHTWTLLPPTRKIYPKAQSFAAEIESKNGQTCMLIGGGYGITDKCELSCLSDAFEGIDEYELMASTLKKSRSDYDKHVGTTDEANMKSECSENLYEVVISDESQGCSFDDNILGKSWACEFFDAPGDKRPHGKIDLSPWSLTMHIQTDMCMQDFQKPPLEISPDDDRTLGFRVKLHGLKGRTDLNGASGRCGLWMKKKGRYQVILPSHEPGGPASILVRVENLLAAEPLVWSRELVAGKLPKPFPSVTLTCAIPKGWGQAAHCPLDFVIDGHTLPCDEKDPRNLQLLSDRYRGPVSPQAQVILRAIVDQSTAFKSHTSLAFVSKQFWKKDQQAMRQQQVFADFYSKLKQVDSARVKKYQASILQQKIFSTDWVKLSVTVDGLNPPIKRELIVSPNITMQCLHHQVLCPAIGWTNNFHCYAFRCIDSMTPEERQEVVPEGFPCPHGSWIGPKVSTAIDSMFQPLFIGGAVANAKKIRLGHLLSSNAVDDSIGTIQYVHDYGDWWSHTIEITKYNDTVPRSASVAFLLSGEGGCPPEDIGGVGEYVSKMCQLTGKVSIENDDDKEITPDWVDPANERWWALLNAEVRGKTNSVSLSSPLNFDLEAARAEIASAIRRPKQKSGLEVERLTTLDYRTGLSSEFSGNRSRAPIITDRRKACALCGVTVALKLCSSCQSVAFCCQDHLVEFWPKHKAECKQVRKAARRKDTHKSN